MTRGGVYVDVEYSDWGRGGVEVVLNKQTIPLTCMSAVTTNLPFL